MRPLAYRAVDRERAERHALDAAHWRQCTLCRAVWPDGPRLADVVQAPRVEPDEVRP